MNRCINNKPVKNMTIKDHSFSKHAFCTAKTLQTFTVTGDPTEIASWSLLRWADAGSHFISSQFALKAVRSKAPRLTALLYFADYVFYDSDIKYAPTDYFRNTNGIRYPVFITTTRRITVIIYNYIFLKT